METKVGLGRLRVIDITKQAKEVFGDRVVKSAYVIDSYDNLSEDSIKLSDMDSNEFVVEFNRGNTVRFCASEWLSVMAI